MINEYLWPAADVSAVCNTQSLTGAGTLKLNGTQVFYDAAGVATFNFPGLYRSVSITAQGVDLSGVTFTITGYYKGAIKTITMAGPAANSTVDSAIVVPTPVNSQLFYSVISVTTDAAVTNVSVGSGVVGITIPYKINYYGLFKFFGAAMRKISDPIQWAIYLTVENMEMIDDPVAHIIGNPGTDSDIRFGDGPLSGTYIYAAFNNDPGLPPSPPLAPPDPTMTGGVKFTFNAEVVTTTT